MSTLSGWILRRMPLTRSQRLKFKTTGFSKLQKIRLTEEKKIIGLLFLAELKQNKMRQIYIVRS